MGYYTDLDNERGWDEQAREDELERTRDSMYSGYHTAKDAKTGTTISCPVCGKKFTKKSYQQAFCGNKGTGNCKDRYWNTISDTRLNRAINFS